MITFKSVPRRCPICKMVTLHEICPKCSVPRPVKTETTKLTTREEKEIMKTRHKLLSHLPGYAEEIMP